MSQLTLSQRYEISILNDQKLSQSEIAYKVGANKSTISRELKRNSDGRSGEYRAELAQKKCTLRHSVKNKKKTFTATIQEFIERYLKVIEGAFYSHRKEAVYTAGFVANIVYDGIRADKEIKKNYKPVLIIHSNEDKTTPFKFGQKLFDKANEPKYFMEIEKEHLQGLVYSRDSIKLKINEIFRMYKQ